MQKTADITVSMMTARHALKARLKNSSDSSKDTTYF